MPPQLPEPPHISLEIMRERESDKTGFANVRRLELRASYQDGSVSNVFAYDVVDRRALDAVIICAYYTQSNRIFLYLRSCVRPPLAVRENPRPATLWELPAGLIEKGETPAEAGARETEEELGFRLDPKQMIALGREAAPAPALIGELHHFVRVEVSPDARGEPSLDGSPLERNGVVIAMPLEEALTLAKEGAFLDEKTELGIRRLADVLLAKST